MESAAFKCVQHIVLLGYCSGDELREMESFYSTIICSLYLRIRHDNMTEKRPSERHHRSIAKAISWRATGSVDTFIVSFFVTGRFTIAGSIAAAELLTKVVLYYFHERIWGMIRWGRE